MHDEDSANVGAPPVRDGRSTRIVVGIGASAGGLRALQQFFEAVPASAGFAYVVILHLDPDRESRVAELLQTRTTIPVKQVREDVRIEPNHAYIIGPHHDLAMQDGMVRLTERAPRGAHAPVDLFFRTLADAHGPAAVGIVLSGTGRDGVLGLRRIKEQGGITFAQAPAEAEYDGMPKAAIATGDVDLVLSVADMPAALGRLPPAPLRFEVEPGGSASSDDELLKMILARVRGRTGHDFLGYKPSTVLRRIGRRMRFRGGHDLEGYLALLRRDPEEADALFHDLFITVTSFFRDPEAFEVVERRVIPRLFEGRGGADQVRVWTTGCATGEEAYSLAILLSEHAAKLDDPPRLQIFATDLSERAVSFARDALYPESTVGALTPERLDRFFEQEAGGYRVKKPVRERVVFATHDLLRDPPFSRLDLVSCRNVLIYLRPEVQSRVLDTFHYAIRPHGFLFLGTSESAEDADGQFDALDAKQRVYRRRPGVGRPQPHLTERRPAPAAPERAGPEEDAERTDYSYGAAHLRLVEAYAPPSLVVDARHEVVHLSERAGEFLRLGPGTLTRSVYDLVAGQLRLELRTALYEAFRHRRATRRTVPFEMAGRTRLVDLDVRPAPGDASYALVVFDEHAPAPSGGDDEPAARAEPFGLAALEEELRRTRGQLNATVQEREATIEELQSSNEELQSINEEQRATTEELETSREELQSINEELTTVNQEHRNKIEELAQTNADLNNLIASTQIGTIFLDRRLRIRRFTPAATSLFNILDSDIGRPFAHLTHQLSYAGFADDAARVLASLEPHEVEVADASGRWLIVRLTPYRSQDDRIDGVVLTFIDITARKVSELDVQQARAHAEAGERRLATLMENMQSGIVIVEAPSGRIAGFNQRARDIWQADLPRPESVEGYGAAFSGRHEGGERYLPAEWPMARAIRDGEIVLDEPIAMTFDDGRQRHLLVSAAPVFDDDGAVESAIVSLVDVTERKAMEEELRRAMTVAEEANRARSRFLATISHEFRTPLNAIIGYADLIMGGTADEQTAQRLERIKTSAWHLAAMVDELLDYSRLEAGREVNRWEPCDAVRLAREAVSMIEDAAADKQLDVRMNLPDEPVLIDCDPGKLRQILVNLLGNAVKYTDAGGVTLSVDGSADEVSFTVWDSGVGIEPTAADRVFDEFFQVNPLPGGNKGGVGLGLAVARRYARLGGGDISLASTPGVGSTFTLRLPRRRPRAEPTDG